MFKATALKKSSYLVDENGKGNTTAQLDCYGMGELCNEICHI